jgi:hypothetical protein
LEICPDTVCRVLELLDLSARIRDLTRSRRS